MNNRKKEVQITEGPKSLTKKNLYKGDVTSLECGNEVRKAVAYYELNKLT